MNLRTAGAIIGIAIGAGSASAQIITVPDIVDPGAVAMAGSTVGGFAPYLGRDLFSRDITPAVFHLRYGTRKQDSVTTHSIGGTVEMPALAGRFGVTGGVQLNEGTASILLGGEYQTLFSRGMVTGNPSGPLLLVSFKFEAGAGITLDSENPQRLFSSAMTLPMSLPFGTDVVLAPFVGPSIGFGVVSTSEVTDYAMQIAVVAGLVISNPSRFDFTIGLHRPIVDDASNVYGIGLTWNR